MWPIEDRAALASEIWSSMGPDAPEPELTSEQLADLRKRWQEHLDHPENVYSWEEVKASLRQTRQRKQA